MYAGANSGSNSNRFYSFSRGLSHFVVLTAEAYLYARTPAFLANQLAWLQSPLAPSVCALAGPPCIHFNFNKQPTNTG